MKKLVLLLVAATTLVACDNGIGENLDALTARLAEVNAELAAATSDLGTDIEDIAAELQSALETAQESKEAIEAAIAQVADIQGGLEGVLAALEDVATDEDVAALLARVQELSETVQNLIDYGDSDYDGIINYLDKCPGTDPGVEVDTDGCPTGD